MKLIKYNIVCNTINEGTPEEEEILLEKKLTYSAENLIIAQNEAYKGEYTIIEDEEPEPKEVVIPIELGGTGVKTLEEVRKKFGIDKANGLALQGVIENLTMEEDTPAYWHEKSEGTWFVSNYITKQYEFDERICSGFIMNFRNQVDPNNIYTYQIFMDINANSPIVYYRNEPNNNFLKWTYNGWHRFYSSMEDGVVKGSYTGHGEVEKTLNYRTDGFKPMFVMIQGDGKQIIGFRGETSSYSHDLVNSSISLFTIEWYTNSIILTSNNSAIFNKSGANYSYIILGN